MDRILSRLIHISAGDIGAKGLDDLVAMSAGVTILESEYAKHRLVVPDWLTSAKRTLVAQIDIKRRESIALRRKQLERAIAGTETPTERRTRLEKELDALAAEEAQPVG